MRLIVRAVLSVVVMVAWILLGRTPSARLQAADLVAPSEALTPEQQRTKFHLPPGFEIQLVASEPQIHKPINLTFDRRGRLFVTDTLEYPFPAADSANARDTVKVITIRTSDGAAENISTMVDKLNIPLGVMPLENGVIVYAIPKVLKCIDADGDGIAELRSDLYGTFGSRDTHGMVNSFTRGLDGWLYACHGFNNDSTATGGDGQSITMNSGNTFRMRMDGTHVEYFTHGQVNPFGLTFDSLGNLYSADCHTLPLYQLLRGAYYPSFGKAHDGLGFGPTMIGHDHGSTGIGGVAFYEAEQFPADFRGNMFVGNPVTGRVNRDKLQPQGSTFVAQEQPDLVVCDDPWFRPVNLQVGPDGALYIADFYNRIIGHYEVPLTHPGRDRERGRIWRVVYTGKGVQNSEPIAATAMVDVSAKSLKELIELLSHGNLSVRTQATHELVDRFPNDASTAALAVINDAHSKSIAKAHALWVVERASGLDNDSVSKLAGDADRLVRVHVVKALAERARWDEATQKLVVAKLNDEDAFVCRAAADALGRHPLAEQTPPLLSLWSRTPGHDTHTVHVVRMAIRDHLLKEGVYGELAELLGSDQARLMQIAQLSLGVPTAGSADFLKRQVAARLPGPRSEYLQHVVRYLPPERLDEVKDLVGEFAKEPIDQQYFLARAVGRGCQERGAALPDFASAWTASVTLDLLSSDKEHFAKAGIELARDVPTGGAHELLAKAAGPDARYPGLRAMAIDACMAIDGARSLTMLQDIIANEADSFELRQRAAQALGRANNAEARTILGAQLIKAPSRMATELAVALTETGEGAETLLSIIDGGKASPQLLQDAGINSRVRSRGLADIDARLQKLLAGLPAQDQRTRELLDRRRQSYTGVKPDAVAGLTLFTKHCAACHRIGDAGAKVGPNLDGVGIRGIDRVLEDVLDPNRNVDQAFRTTQVQLNDGRVQSGLSLREEGEILVLADAQGKEVRVPKNEIEQRSVSPLSLMPANFSEQLSEADFANLLGYLLSQRQGKE